MYKKTLLVFHTVVAPYRVDFFNSLWQHFDMTMCIDRREDYASLYQDIEKEYHFNYSEFNTGVDLWKTIKFVLRSIKRAKPDIVFVSECGVVSLIVVLFRLISFHKYRIVSIIDDSYNMLIDSNQFTKRHEKAERVLIPCFDEIINVEPRVSDFFQRKYGKGVCFPIIRDEIKFRKELTDALPLSNEYIKKYDLSGKKVVLFVGRFVALKNVPLIIKAVQSLNNDRVKLVLVGAGPEEKKYRKIANPDTVIFAGQQSGLNLYAWYNVANILVLASSREAFGAVTNEALMAGCKCIVSERAGSSSLIKSGVNGYIFNPLDEEELYEKLNNLLDEDNTTDVEGFVKPCLMQTTFTEEFKHFLNNLEKN